MYPSTLKKRLYFFYYANKMWSLYLKDFQRVIVETYDTERKPPLPRHPSPLEEQLTACVHSP